jgi:hypothetical protein
MKNKKRLLMPVVFGITASSFAFIANSASAANLLATNCTGTDLGVILNQGTDETAFKSNCATVTQLAKIQGRSGTNGPTLNGDYEIAIGPNGAQAGLTGQSQIDWNSGTVYNWELNFNPTTNQATFQVLDNGKGSPTNLITYSYGASSTMPFNAFGILARADNPSSIITANTTMNLSVTQVTLDGGGVGKTTNFGASPLSVTAISTSSGTSRFAKNYYTVDPAAGTEITQMKGTFSANFTGLNPQDKNGRSSGIGFEITLFDPPPSPAVSQPVPEPNSMLGLFAFGVLGAGSLLKRKK